SAPLGKSTQASLGAKGADLDIQAITRGVSWSDTSLLSDRSDMRILEGEIVVPPKTSPELKMALFELHYSVTFAINAVGFVPHDRDAMISKYPIRIVSHPALGVPPISRVPPGYEQNTSRDNGKDLDWAILSIANRTMNRTSGF
ncbi:hypothetical protein FRC07_013718, partial [Ceratobasidium sp. 392]